MSRKSQHKDRHWNKCGGDQPKVTENILREKSERSENLMKIFWVKNKTEKIWKIYFLFLILLYLRFELSCLYELKLKTKFSSCEWDGIANRVYFDDHNMTSSKWNVSFMNRVDFYMKKYEKQEEKVKKSEGGRKWEKLIFHEIFSHKILWFKFSQFSWLDLT